MENNLDIILDSKIKIKIIRLFISRNQNFRASGREIARFIKASPPTTHLALKELNSRSILNLEIIGKQHIYSLNVKNRTVKDILVPTFRKELSLKEDIEKFLFNKIKGSKIKHKIASLVLYGSLQRGKAVSNSDADIAVIVKDKPNEKEITEKFIEDIAPEFNEYFGIHLDAYVKCIEEFIYRLKKRLPPVSSLAESYTVIFGKDPLELIQSYDGKRV